jgi:arginine utilization regulatory protein
MHCIECAFNLNHEHRALIRPDQLPKYMLIAMQEQKTDCQSIPLRTTLNQADQALQEAEEPVEQLPAGSIIEQLRQQEKEEIIIALKKSKGNIARAAEELGLSRQRLHYRLKKYSLR